MKRLSVWVQDFVSGVADWTNGTWRLRDRLIPEVSDLADGSMGRSTFRMLRRTRNDGSGAVADTFQPQRGQYVIVADRGGVTPFDSTIHWAGQIVGIHTQPLRGEDDEVGSVDAIELGSVLDLTPVANLCQRDPAGGLPIALATNPTANLAGSDGQVIGNCYTGTSPKLFESLPDNIGAGTSVAKWSRWDLLSHVLTYAPAWTLVPTLSLSAGSTFATYLQQTTDEVFELDGLSLREFIDLMVGPGRGGSWRVVPTASGWTIACESAADVAVGSFPAQSATNVALNGNDVDLVLNASGSEVPDAVEVIGAPIVYCGTVSPIDGSLGAGWSSAQETAYKAGASGTSGYAGWVTQKKIAQNRAVRSAPSLQDVFVRFELKRYTPTADLQCSSVTAAGSPPAGGSTQALCPAIGWDGSSVSVSSSAASPYLPTARVLPFLPFPLNASSASDSAKAQPKYPEPLVYRYTSPAIDAWPGMVDLRNPPAGSWDTPDVDPDERGPVLRIRYRHPEVLARADWSGAAVSEFDPTLTTSYGASDWRSLVVTLAVEGDQRVKATALRSGVTTPRNVVRVYRPDLHCWLVRAGTVYGLDASGALHYSADTFTRNDFPTAQRLANEYAAFAFRSRTGATITVTDPTAPPAWATVGTLIGTVSETDSNGNVLATRTLNTVVRSVRMVWDANRPRLIVTTDYPQAPGGAASAERLSVSLGGKPSQALQRTRFDLGDVAREVHGRRIQTGQSGRPDVTEVRKFNVNKTAHGWTVGKWIGRSGSNWILADYTGTYDGLAMVVEVVDANNVTVATGSGYLYAPTLTYSDFTPYWLTTSGTPGTQPTKGAIPTTPIKWRVLFWALESKWLWLTGSYVRDSHNHDLGDTADVGISGLANGDLLQYDSGSQLWKNVAGGGIIGNRSALSVFGNSTNASAPGADIASSADGQVLLRVSGTLAWGTVTSANMNAVIAAGGPTGSSSVVPVITYDAAGRLTAVSSATITPAAIGAVDTATFSAHTHTLAGDVGGTTAATVIGNDKVLTAMVADDQITNAKLANMAQATIKGRASGAGTGDPTDLTSAQATAILDVMGASGAGHKKGLVPDTPAVSGTTKYLREDGTWDIPTGTGANDLDDLTDVVITTPLDNHFLRYDQSATVWENVSAVDAAEVMSACSYDLRYRRTNYTTATAGTTHTFQIGSRYFYAIIIAGGGGGGGASSGSGNLSYAGGGGGAGGVIYLFGKVPASAQITVFVGSGGSGGAVGGGAGGSGGSSGITCTDADLGQTETIQAYGGAAGSGTQAGEGGDIDIVPGTNYKLKWFAHGYRGLDGRNGCVTAIDENSVSGKITSYTTLRGKGGQGPIYSTNYGNGGFGGSTGSGGTTGEAGAVIIFESAE